MPPLRARARVRSVRRRAGSQQGWARRLASSAQRSCPGLRKTCVASARPPCQAPRSLASCPVSLLQSQAASCLGPGQTRKRAANPTRTRAHFELVRQLLRQRCNGLQVLHVHHRRVHSHAGVVMLDGCGREGGTGSMRKTSMVDCCSQAGLRPVLPEKEKAQVGWQNWVRRRFPTALACLSPLNTDCSRQAAHRAEAPPAVPPDEQSVPAYSRPLLGARRMPLQCRHLHLRMLHTRVCEWSNSGGGSSGGTLISAGAFPNALTCDQRHLPRDAVGGAGWRLHRRGSHCS